MRNSKLAKAAGFSSVQQMNDLDILEMIKSQSASPLGLDRRIVDYYGSRGKSLQESNILNNLAADAAPNYSRGYVTNLIFDNAQTNLETSFIEQFNTLHGTSYSLDPKISANTVDTIRKTRTSKEVMAALDIALENITAQSALSSEGKPLGTYINRQGMAVSTQGQISEVLEQGSFKGALVPIDVGRGTEMVPIQDYYRLKYSVGLIPPSDAVDLVKELVLPNEEAVVGRLMKLQEMETILQEIMHARSSGVTDDVILKTMSKDLFEKFGLKPDSTVSDLLITLQSAGKGAVETTAEGLGYLQGMQVASGVARQELIGFDPALLMPGHVGRRVYEIDEMESLRNKTIEGLKQAEQHVARNSRKRCN